MSFRNSLVNGALLLYISLFDRTESHSCCRIPVRLALCLKRNEFKSVLFKSPYGRIFPKISYWSKAVNKKINRLSEPL